MKPHSWHSAAWNSLLKNKQTPPHALLITGQQGIGKYDFALAFAQTLLCEAPLQDTSACEACIACNWFANERHPDVRIVSPEALTDKDDSAEKKASLQISIDQIRNLSDFVTVSPHRGLYKIILIHPAEALNVHAANSLLKLLEEPPAKTLLILISHRPRRLLPTIISRCYKIQLCLPNKEQALAWLNEAGVKQTELALAQAGGAPVIASTLDEENYWKNRNIVLDALADKDFDPVALVEQIQGYDLSMVLSWLEKWTYDMIFLNVVGSVRYHLDYQRALQSISKQLKRVDMVRYYRTLLENQRVVNHPLNPKLFLEQIFFAYFKLLNRDTSNG